MIFYICTGNGTRDEMLSALANRLSDAEVVIGLPDSRTFTGTVTVTSLSVLEKTRDSFRSEYAIVLYDDDAYLSSGRHYGFSVEYSEKYRAVRLPLSVAEMLRIFEDIIRGGEDGCAQEKPRIVYDRGARSLSFKGNTETLTKLESELYELFCQSCGAPLSKETIRCELWGDSCRSNAPDVYVSYLRRKLDRLTGEGSITNVRGVGYKMNI